MYVVAVVVPNPKALQDAADLLKISSNWTELCSNSALTDHVLKQMKAQAQGKLSPLLCCYVI